jgi:hypothetical protein
MLLDCARRFAPLLFVATMSACSVNATVTTTDSCTSDPTLVCGGGTGYSCTGGRVQSIPGQVCSTDGVGDFCCYVTSCQPDPRVICGASADGYSCAAGDDPPDSVDDSLVCSEPTPAGGADLYCCYQPTVAPGSTCQPDSSVQGCEPDATGAPSYGFSCTGADSPMADYSNLQCSDPTDGEDAAGNAASLYCCTYQ